MPVGGIMPARSFRTIFSASSGLLREVREIQLVEQQIGGLQLLVVADDAVLIENGAMLGDVRVGGGRRDGGGPLRGDGGPHRGGTTGRLLRPRGLASHVGH